MGKGSKQVKNYVKSKQEDAKLKKAQVEFDRKRTKQINAVRIVNINRDILFKQNQVDTGEIVETRSIHRLPDGTATIVDGYIDHLKPKHILQNEIDEAKNKVEFYEEQIKQIEQIEEEENARETTTN